MAKVYSSSVSRKTINDALQAYKDSKETVDRLKDTVEIDKIIKPVYNYRKK